MAMNPWVIFIGVMILSWIVSATMKSRFKKYSKIPVDNGMSGKEIAERMLRDNGIYDVTVQSVPGQLTDHYNPEKKTINLSQDVYSSRSIAAAAVAAHETGHAVQHATAYAWLGFRSKMVPVVSFSSRWIQWVLLGGIILVNTFPLLLLTGIVLFALTTLFSFITLPVEFNASQRALAWLSDRGVTSYENQSRAKDALKWAASTYVVAALGSLATLLYYVMIFTGARDD
ncbi:MAG TPA: zinc metallopeptidase [Bacteroidales bacterium]|jgi:Zn-dependent membrane protease YugP|nr:zinc metallopeptidase [Bacteroidales bacterium]HOX75574.1 zinc metallopeptidase [Bacteroidales bacterium]HQM67826.1 zinc metallopeptidase [Bacteroidales bacterium]